MRQKRTPPGWGFRGGLGDRRKDVRAKDGKELPNASKKHLHVLAVRLGKPRAASLILFERESVDRGGLGKEAALKIPHMSLGQVLVLADEHDGGNPEFLGLVLLEAVANDLRLANVSARCVGKRIGADENVNSGLVEFLAG